MIDLWYKSAVIYCLDVDTFMDGNGDGIGDFVGLADRLDHIAGLGATCIWLMPFYPSPDRDNGYDVIDYYAVDPRLGTLGDFVSFVHRARERGIRILIDLVINHTSIDHPWFQAARCDPASPYRDYYVWSDERPADAEEGIVFPGVQEAAWTWDEPAGAWYHHRFYAHQPDLNIANPAVREEIEKIMGFWLQLGVAGFRLDAAPFLIEMHGAATDADDDYAYLRELRAFLSWRRGDAVILAEANVAIDGILEYFGTGDRLHMLFSFLVNQHIFLALAREQAEPLRRILAQLPPIPDLGQWAHFLRNHDELDLGRLSENERAEVLAAFAPDADMRVYGRGIRRRLAPMLGCDPQRLALAFSLMLTLPGTPVIYYGDEIGMGDDLGLPERNAVRTPMQWSDGRNGGFSTAPPDRLIRPAIRGGDFGYERVNVVAASRHRDSLLNRLERMIRTRHGCPEFGWGDCQVIEVGPPSVFAHRATWRGQSIVALHNLSAEPCEVSLDLGAEADGEAVELISETICERPEGSSLKIELSGYEFHWLRLGPSRG